MFMNTKFFLDIYSTHATSAQILSLLSFKIRLLITFFSYMEQCYYVCRFSQPPNTYSNLVHELISMRMSWSIMVLMIIMICYDIQICFDTMNCYDIMTLWLNDVLWYYVLIWCREWWPSYWYKYWHGVSSDSLFNTCFDILDYVKTAFA